MITYAARAVSWSLAAAGCLFVVLAMGLVGGWPATMWPLEGTAVGVLAGVTAWAQDEPCADVVDTLPRSLRWRTVARSSAAVAALAVWMACLCVTRHRLPPHLALFALQGVAAIAAALAVAARRRLNGDALPGRAVATLVIPVVTALALIRPLAQWLPLFPVWPDDRWGLSNLVWLAIGGGSLAALGELFRVEGRPA